VAFSYLDRLLHAPSIPAAVARFREVLASKEVGLMLAFEDEIYKEFSEQLHTLMQLVEDFGAALTTEDLLDRLLEGMQQSYRLQCSDAQLSKCLTTCRTTSGSLQYVSLSTPPRLY
jgi:hypothetical protein